MCRTRYPNILVYTKPHMDRQLGLMGSVQLQF